MESIAITCERRNSTKSSALIERLTRTRLELLPSGEFWLLAITTFLFNLGVSVFMFLYNLLMLDLGFRERSLGIFASALALGGMAGTIPMGMVAGRLGLKRVLTTSLLLIGISYCARAFLIWPPAQVVFSFLDGLMLCGWVVCAAPAVAMVVEEERRPFAFSVIYASAIASQSLAGVIGGNMPVWCRRAGEFLASAQISSVTAMRITMAAACAIIAFAALPVALLTKDARHSSAWRFHRPSRFLVRFLIAMALWGGAVALFNPFTNVFFSRHLGVATARLGNFFGVAQLLQAAIVLTMPILVKRAGLSRGIFVAQLATSAALVWLSRESSLLGAEAAYCAYMGAQHLCDPAIQSLLMNRVAEKLRSEATSMTYLVLSLAQACSSATGGFAFASFQYAHVLLGVAAAAAGAAVLFRWLCFQPGQPPPNS